MTNHIPVSVTRYKLWCIANGHRPSNLSADPVERAMAAYYYTGCAKREKADIKEWLTTTIRTQAHRTTGEAQIARVMSVAHILESPTGTLEEAGKVLGITRERLRQLINQYPELHHLHADHRKDMRAEISVEIAEGVMDLMNSEGATISDACDRFEISLNKFNQFIKQNEVLFLTYKKLQKDRKAIKAAERKELIAKVLTEAQETDQSIRRVSMELQIPISQQKYIYAASGKPSRKRRSAKEVEELMQRVRSLIVEGGHTKCSAIKEVAASSSESIWLQQKVNFVFKDDAEFQQFAEFNRHVALCGRNCKAGEVASYLITKELREDVKKALHEHLSMAQISEKIHTPPAVIQKVVRQLMTEDDALAEMVWDDRRKYKEGFFNRLKGKNPSLTFKGRLA